jgi:hypothetical protein
MAKWDWDKISQPTDREKVAGEIWAAFKDGFDGEKKYALRLIVKYLKNTPGGEAEGQCPPRADGSSEDG